MHEADIRDRALVGGRRVLCRAVETRSPSQKKKKKKKKPRLAYRATGSGATRLGDRTAPASASATAPSAAQVVTARFAAGIRGSFIGFGRR